MNNNMFNIFSISGSALNAQSERINLIADNLANANNVASSREGAYRARQPLFKERYDGFERKGGVEVKGVVESDRAIVPRYEPNHPLADKNGYIYPSNVSSEEEMANMISAQRSYQQNIKILSTAKQLMLKTLQMGE